MANVQDVAKFFIGLANDQANNDQGDLMTNLRLQKLLYFAQGWHLARYGKPLFEDEIEAWPYGPVVPSVYDAYKQHGRGGITGSLPDADAFTEEEFSLLLDVAREYDRFGTSSLVNMTHKAGSPWSLVGGHGRIPRDLIRSAFDAERPLTSFADVQQFAGVYVPERDEAGTPIIPSDFAEDWDDDNIGDLHPLDIINIQKIVTGTR